jgi:hypothetical protein
MRGANAAHRKVIDYFRTFQNRGGIFNMRHYLPDRPPTWSDVVTVVSGILSIGVWLQSFRPLSLPMVTLGFGGTAILLGPVARTRVGDRINKWRTEIGPAGRVSVIALFAIAVIVAVGLEATPTALIRDFGLGVFMFAVLVLAAHLLHERRIKGWLPDTS